MTIYWERCDLCGRYHVVKKCPVLGINVCPHCCLACPRRQRCPSPVWKFGEGAAKKRSEKKLSTAEEIILELLQRVEKNTEGAKKP